MLCGAEQIRIPLRGCLSWAGRFDRDTDGFLNQQEINALTADWPQNWFSLFECTLNTEEPIRVDTVIDGRAAYQDFEPRVIAMASFFGSSSLQRPLYCAVQDSAVAQSFDDELSAFYNRYRNRMSYFVNQTFEQIIRRFQYYCGSSGQSVEEFFSTFSVRDAESPYSVASQDLLMQEYPNYEAIFRELLADRPPAVGLAEIHFPALYAGMSTIEFLIQYLYIFQEAGYQDIVLEFLPYDIDDYEVDYFMMYGAIDENTPVLREEIITSLGSGEDYLALLERCRELGIRFHGGSADHEALNAARNNEEYNGSIPDYPYLMEQTGIHTRHTVGRLVNEGRLVIVYGGANHNDIEIPQDARRAGIPRSAYGHYLWEDGVYFLEIDFINAGVMIEHTRRGEVGIAILLNYYRESILTPHDALLVSRTIYSHAIIMPR